MNKLRLILLMFIVLNSSLLSAQLKDGEYKKVPELDKFEGTWQWGSGDSTLTICLEKVNFNLKMQDKKNPDIGMDVIVGWHSLKVGNKVIQSSMDKKSKKFDPKHKKHSIWGGLSDRNSDILFIYDFRDIKTQEVWKGSLSFNTNEDILLMELSRSSSEWDSFLRKGKVKAFTLPKNVTFKRIKD